MGLLDSVLGAVMNNGQQPQAGQANGGGIGGLGGLVGKFQQAGLGDAINSWIGGGPNQPVSGEEISNALGDNTVSNIATRLGVAPEEAAEQISKVLPGILNHLTPNGEAPAQGLGDHGDLMGMLGGLLASR